MDLRIPVALLLPLVMTGCQGHFVGADGRPLRPFQDSPATPAAMAPSNPAQAQTASAPEAGPPADAR